MILIIGGAYQGKLTYAVKTFALTQNDLWDCADGPVDFSKKCIYHLEQFTMACVRKGVDSTTFFQKHRAEWEDSILICRDISCGVVPLGAELRQWRNETGRLCQYLSQEAQQVSRIFCGLEQRLK